MTQEIDLFSIPSSESIFELTDVVRVVDINEPSEPMELVFEERALVELLAKVPIVPPDPVHLPFLIDLASVLSSLRVNFVDDLFVNNSLE